LETDVVGPAPRDFQESVRPLYVSCQAVASRSE
jgi:hypothetical protein